MKTKTPEPPARARAPSQPDSATFAPVQKWPPATPYTRKSLRSLPYASSWLQNRRNPQLTRIFRDVCASKSSRSPPYAAARNFCTLKIFYMPACSIFGPPKFSIRTKIFDMRDEKISGSTHPTFRTSRDATYAVKMAYQHNRQKIFLGGQTISLRFLTPQRGSISTRFSAFYISTRLFSI